MGATLFGQILAEKSKYIWLNDGIVRRLQSNRGQSSFIFMAPSSCTNRQTSVLLRIYMIPYKVTDNYLFQKLISLST